MRKISYLTMMVCLCLNVNCSRWQKPNIDISVPVITQETTSGSNVTNIIKPDGDTIMGDQTVINKETPEGLKESLKVDVWITKVINQGNTGWEEIGYAVVNLGLIDIVVDELRLYCGGVLIAVNRSSCGYKLKPSERKMDMHPRLVHPYKKDKNNRKELVRYGDLKDGVCQDNMKFQVITTRGNEFTTIVDKSIIKED